MVSELKRGDVVRLKSGGPWMTVESPVDPDDKEDTVVMCVWFNRNDLNDYKTAGFTPEVLVKFEGDTNGLQGLWEKRS